jgi:hypothetical protein
MKKSLKMSLLLLSALACLTVRPAAASSHNEVEVKGPIEAISSSAVTVRQATFIIDAQTKFEDRNDRPADPALFVIGATVEVSGKVTGSTLTARKIELKSGGSSVDNPPSGTPGNPTLPGAPTKARLSSRLAPLDAAVTSAASSSYKLESKRGRSEEKFSVGLKIKIPSTVPAAATIDEALALPLEAIITRGGVEFARCTFDVDRIRARRRSASVEFKIDLREKNSASASSFDEKKGQCDIDSATAGVQSGIPALAAGDVISIQASLPAGNVPFLTGAFRASR